MEVCKKPLLKNSHIKSHFLSLSKYVENSPLVLIKKKKKKSDQNVTFWRCYKALHLA